MKPSKSSQNPDIWDDKRPQKTKNLDLLNLNTQDALKINTSDKEEEENVTSLSEEEENYTYNSYYIKKLQLKDLPTEEVIVQKIARVLEMMTKQNESKECPQTVFVAKTLPKMSIESYLKRIFTYSYSCPESYVFSMIFIDRFNLCNKKNIITKSNVHKLVITATMIGAKYNDDTPT